jgi:hypothetical protein
MNECFDDLALDADDHVVIGWRLFSSSSSQCRFEFDILSMNTGSDPLLLTLQE